MSSGSAGNSVAELLAPGGAVARRLEDFELRPQQLRMAEAVAATMAARGRLLVEAGTGVGKSFAYLLPAIDRIVNHGERVVVCTHTIALQEQLVDKDIPLLQAAIGDFSAVLVKGRNNYVSLRRLQQASARQDRLFSDDDVRHALHAVEDWAMTTRDGSRSSLPVLPPSDVWDAVQSDRDNCMGKKCPSHEKCFYQSARRRMEHAHLLVCNHALFFSDLALRDNDVGFLPKYHHVILDEAHTVEDVASDHFGLRMGEGSIEHLMRVLWHERTGRGFLATLRVAAGTEGLVDRAIDATARCRAAAAAFFDDLWRAHAARAGRNGRVDAAGVVENALQPALAELANLLRLVRDAAEGEADKLECAGYTARAAAAAGATG
ncbi:MAG: DEAD/DEAH box helicase, partial [Phycisphaerales bacterium]